MTVPALSIFLARLRRHGATAAFAGLMALLAACAQTSPVPGQEPLVISQSTDAALRQYLAKIYPNHGGAFAVSPDGANSFYAYCPDVACSPPLYGGIAQSQCRSLSGQECLLFFVRDEPRIAYTVAAQMTLGGHHGYRMARPVDEMPDANN